MTRREQITKRIETVTFAAMQFCESCENIGDTENEDYATVKTALELCDKYAIMGLTQLHRAKKELKGDVFVMSHNALAYIDRFTDTFRNLVILELWYDKTFGNN